MNTQDTRFPRRTFLMGTAAFGVMALANPALAFADEISDKQAEADAAYASLTAMQTELDSISDEYTQALQEQEEAEAKMEEAQSQIDQANSNIATLQDHLGNVVTSTYKSGTGQFLGVLLGATSFEEFATSLSLLNDISEDKAKTVVDIKDQRTALEEAKAEYTVQAQTAEQKKNEAQARQEEAEKMVDQYQATYDQLSAEVAELVEQKRLAEEAAAAAQAAAVVAASAEQGAAEEAASQSDDDSDSGSSSGSESSSSTKSSSSKKSSKTYEGGSSTVSRAYSCIGAPYQWAAVGPSAYDCSGLVSYCVTGSHTRAFTSSSLMGYSAVSNPQPGDVCVRSGHCGIYIGGGQMIHAPHTGATVCVASVQSGMKIVRP